MEEKIQCIKDNKDAAIAALDAYLDSIYNLTDKYFDEVPKDDNTGVERVLKAELTPDDKAENYIKELDNDARDYEKVREKLKEDDFNLSLSEIARIGLAFVFVGLTFEKQIKAIKEAQEKTLTIINTLNANLTDNES